MFVFFLRVLVWDPEIFTTTTVALYDFRIVASPSDPFLIVITAICFPRFVAEYYFTTKEEMEQAVANGDFIESTSFAGNMYGTSKKAVAVRLATPDYCLMYVLRS